MLKGSLIITLFACIISSSVALPYDLSDGKLVRREPPPPPDDASTPSEAAPPPSDPSAPSEAAADPLKCLTDAVNVSAQTLGTAQQAISGAEAGSAMPAAPSKANSGSPSKEDPFNSLNQALKSCGYAIVKASPAGRVVKPVRVTDTLTQSVVGSLTSALGGLGQGTIEGGQDAGFNDPADTAAGASHADNTGSGPGGAPPDPAGGDAGAGTADTEPAP